MRVIIAGGGIGGLALGVALRRVGIDCRVLERAPALRRVGGALVVWPNAMRALGQLGLAETVESVGARVDVCRITDAKGRTLTENDISTLRQCYGAPTMGVHRADLIAALYSALPPENVRLGAAVERFVDRYDEDGRGIRVTLADGESLEADLLVGADGIRSRIRQRLFPDSEPRYAGYTAWRGVASLRAPACPPASWRVAVGPGSHCGLMPLSETELYWFATMNTEAGIEGSGSRHRTDALRQFADWQPALTRVIRATPDDQILRTDIYELPRLRRWSRGRVTLLGDAAHATTPALGQGACQAIEDAVVLAACLAGERSLAAALARYERQRCRRTAWVVRESRWAGRFMNLEHPWASRLRDLVLRMSTTRQALRPMHKICRQHLPQLAPL